jgi:hypothetical protein
VARADHLEERPMFANTDRAWGEVSATGEASAPALVEDTISYATLDRTEINEISVIVREFGRHRCVAALVAFRRPDTRARSGESLWKLTTTRSRAFRKERR